MATPDKPIVEGGDEEEYEPYKERKVAAPVSNLGTFLHFLKGSIGTGILAMPMGFKYTGLVLGTIATFVTGGLCSYGLNLLMSTEYLLCKRKKVPYLSYSDAMAYAVKEGPPCLRWFSMTSGILVNVFLITYQLGICSVYVILVAKSVKLIIDDYNCDIMSLIALIGIFAVFFLLINYVPNLKIFAPLSGVANVLMLIGLIVIMYYVFSKMPATLGGLSLYGQPEHWVLFIGICLFAIESIGVVCSAEYAMKNPQRFGGFTGILNLSLMVVTFLYWFLGFCGYIRYGVLIKGSITLNLPRGKLLAEITQGLFAAALVVSYGLQCFPAIEIIWEYVVPRLKDTSKSKTMFYQYLLRTLLVILTVVFAIAFSAFLGHAISLVGVVCLSMLGFAFPGLMNLCLLYPDKYGKHNWIAVKDILLVILGICLLCAGFFSVIYDIINEKPGMPDCPVTFSNETVR